MALPMLARPSDAPTDDVPWEPVQLTSKAAQTSGWTTGRTWEVTKPDGTVLGEVSLYDDQLVLMLAEDEGYIRPLESHKLKGLPEGASLLRLPQTVLREGFLKLTYSPNPRVSRDLLAQALGQEPR